MFNVSLARVRDNDFQERTQGEFGALCDREWDIRSCTHSIYLAPTVGDCDCDDDATRVTDICKIVQRLACAAMAGNNTPMEARGVCSGLTCSGDNNS
jgi:hypothetical protein